MSVLGELRKGLSSTLRRRRVALSQLPPLSFQCRWWRWLWACPPCSLSPPAARNAPWKHGCGRRVSAGRGWCRFPAGTPHSNPLSSARPGSWYYRTVADCRTPLRRKRRVKKHSFKPHHKCTGHQCPTLNLLGVIVLRHKITAKAKQIQLHI